MKKTKSLPKLKQELQILVNRFIRLRDEGRPCISCGQFKPLQAGHYFAVKGYDGLRFYEDNIHGECAGCNCFNENHLIFYTENLIKRIGKKGYDDLFKRAMKYKQNGNKWMKFEILELMRIYKDKLKQFN